ncbi:hypothetical protein HN587_02490 [Candidatus Woesearchaeota archaeon]|jgi:hypothetical protein|nr:hypothetical protein [Candidatus Woesearchaeota archaeon]
MFNPKFAIISAVTNGTIAVAVNCEHGSLEMLAAGGTQALASFMSTGVTARIVQHFSPIKNKFTSYFFGSLIPALATFAISYGSHTLNGTPELLESCIAPVTISYTTSYVTNFITRRGYLLPGNYPSKD